MRRWRCDESSMKQPIQWPVTAEREVQDILWLMLRPVFDDLVDEETLPKAGAQHLPGGLRHPEPGHAHRSQVRPQEQRLQGRSRSRYWWTPSPTCNGVTAYKEIVVFIYDESASVQEHDTTAARCADSTASATSSSCPGPANSQGPLFPSACGYSQTCASNRT